MPLISPRELENSYTSPDGSIFIDFDEIDNKEELENDEEDEEIEKD